MPTSLARAIGATALVFNLAPALCAADGVPQSASLKGLSSVAVVVELGAGAAKTGSLNAQHLQDVLTVAVQPSFVVLTPDVAQAELHLYADDVAITANSHIIFVQLSVRQNSTAVRDPNLRYSATTWTAAEMVVLRAATVPTTIDARLQVLGTRLKTDATAAAAGAPPAAVTLQVPLTKGRTDKLRKAIGAALTQKLKDRVPGLDGEISCDKLEVTGNRLTFRLSSTVKLGIVQIAISTGDQTVALPASGSVDDTNVCVDVPVPNNPVTICVSLGDFI